MTRVRVSQRMLALLRLVDRYSSGRWGDAWAHYGEVHDGARPCDFDHTRNALVRNGLVIDGDPIEITARGRLALQLASAGILRVYR